MSRKRRKPLPREAIEQAEKLAAAIEHAPEVERARDVANLSRQPRFDKSPAVFGHVLRWLQMTEIEVPAYATDSRARDARLREVWRLEPRLSGVLNSVMLIDANRGWSLVGGRNQVKRYTDILRECEGGDGWRYYVRRAALSYYATDIGAITEVGRDGPGGPMRALFHVDSARCKLSGDRDAPLYYYPSQGGQQPWPRDGFFRVASMPSDDERFHGLGWCAVSRCLEIARLLYAVLCHDQEQLAARAPRGLLLLKGIQQQQWDDAMAQRDAILDSKDYRYYGALTVLAGMGMDEVDAKLVALSQLPVGFDAQKFLDFSMFSYALAFGYDPSEFWPVQFGALGRGRETEMQHLKASGKGGLDFCLSYQERLQRELPESLHFEFEQRDDEGELATIAVQRAKADLVRTLYEAGGIARPALLTPEQTLELLAEMGVVPEEWTPVEEDVEVTDTDDSGVDPEEPTAEAERYLDSPRVQRAMELFPRESIIKATWTPHGLRWRTLWQPRERPRLHVVRREEGAALYQDDDVTITEADVERAIDEGRRRVGEEFAALLDAPEWTAPEDS
jgi:hypothetical protein